MISLRFHETAKQNVLHKVDSSGESMFSQLIQEIKVLALDECESVRKSVRELEPIWDTDRYRLGAGISYYKPPVFYYATSRRTNPILQKHFGWMYDKLLKTFAESFNCSVAYRDDLALPGFNIYCGPIDFETVNYNVHVDLQFMDLNWSPPNSADFQTTMSFTLPIASPACGSGLNIWPITQNDISEDEIDSGEKLREEHAIYQQYTLGFATIHDGKHYHQMSIAKNRQPGDERITLQGHGVKQDGVLIVYG